MKVEEMLRKLGVNATYVGYKLAITAVEIAIKEPDRLTAVTKQLYPECAKKHDVSEYSVERNLRTVAGVAWRRNPELLMKIAGYPMTTPPTAREFVEMLAARVKAKK